MMEVETFDQRTNFSMHDCLFKNFLFLVVRSNELSWSPKRRLTGFWYNINRNKKL